jgi:SAM-dependent methyltransferase
VFPRGQPSCSRALTSTLRHRLGVLRHRLRPPAKGDAEIAWWLHHWDPVLRGGGLYGDALAFLDEDAPADEYWARRRQQARAEVARVRAEAQLPAGVFAGRRVLDVGPGPMGFPDGVAAEARLAIGVEPLAERFREAGLLLDSDAVYLSCGAEAVPLVGASVDVACARNSLDHVEDPEAVVAEMRRLLRPGGMFVANVDLGHEPTPTEPHTIELADLRRWLAGLRIERELPAAAHGEEGRAVVVVATA